MESTLKEFETTNILSVDDDDFNQALASAIFDDYPQINMIEADHGEEALSILKREPIDLILLDLMMPTMNGIDTLKEIKENAEYRNIPVIIVTSKEEEKRKTYELGANDFISKPYNPEELKLRVFNHLKVKKFSKLFSTIQDNINRDEVDSKSHLENLQQAVNMAISSEKKLLWKLGILSREDNEKDINSAKRMGEYIKLMAKLCGLNNKDIESLYYIIAIYNIGFLRVHKEFRTDPFSKAFKAYPLLGVSVLDDLEETSLIKMAKEVILSHRENWDGTGYPHGLKGQEIPLSAQMVSLVDLYDTLTVGRVYFDEVLNSNDALDVIIRESGVKFDPKLLTLFKDNFDLFREIKNKWY